MKKRISILVANPAGNVTIFVRDRFDRKDYSKVANQLLDMKDLKGEQVAFLLGDSRMEMCGLEFCGNASRSFALLTAHEKGLSGHCVIPVDVSGSDEILYVEVDPETEYTRIKMPQPLSIMTLDLSGIAGLSGGDPRFSKITAVDFGGIFHVILPDVEASRETFDAIRDYVNLNFNPPAMGVMFYNTEKNFLVPVVYVDDVHTTYFEGSCGSGTTACCCAFGLEAGAGEHRFVIPQPAGTIETSCLVGTDPTGKPFIEKVFIEGPVELSDEIEVEIEL